MIISKAYIEELVYGRTKSYIVSPFLRLLSALYHLIVLLRRLLFAIGILKQRKVDQRVISVGNITLGGTGKTPAVINIATLLYARRIRPAVISRGYGRSDESAVMVVSDGERVVADSNTGGDEPVLIGSKLTGVPVVVGSDRYQAALFAHRKFGNDTVILDDGFQHIRLHRDLDLVLIDAGDPFGNGKLFPAGILREPLSALHRADAVLITGSDRAQDLESLKGTIRRNTQAAIFTSLHVPADIINTYTGEVRQLDTLRNADVVAFSGIARPTSFISLLGSLGCRVKAEFAYADHYRYKESDIAGILQKAVDANAGMILTTEKDAARLKTLKREEIWALRIELRVVESEEWERLVLKRD